MQHSQKIDSRPAYFDGQLLNAEDFIASQRYARLAMRRHNTALHDWGIVSGLEVRATGPHQVTVQPGVAIDANGRQIDMAHAMPFELAGFPPGVHLRITLAYRDDEEPEREHRNRIDSHAVVKITDDADDKDALLLATLRLDAGGNVAAHAIDATAVRRVRTKIAPGSVGVAALADDLRRGWVAMSLRTIALEKGPEGDKELPPPFRIGRSEARAHEHWNGADNTRGAGGTMAILAPFGARRVHRLRFAGAQNGSRIDVHLIRGGFDPLTNQHHYQPLLGKTVKGQPFNEIWDVEDGAFNPEYNTLALWVRAHGKASVSLVAVEFSY
jgi:hypothetical protein